METIQPMKYNSQLFFEDEADGTLEEVKNLIIEKFFESDSKIVIDFITKFENPVEELEKYLVSKIIYNFFTLFCDLIVCSR